MDFKSELLKLLKTWEQRKIESKKAPSDYVRGISSGFKICQNEVLQLLNKSKV